jgi:NADH:ubiquinone oxidoreductase subunit F (NADH-binding)
MTGAPPLRLLAGPPIPAGAESFTDHQARLGPVPRGDTTTIQVLEASALLGRGGAGFPVGRKWRTVAERSAGQAIVLGNGAEGEPLSAKDRAVMTARPHLVLDGAALAAEAVGAEEIVLYVGSAHSAARSALARAVAERSSAGASSALPPVRIVDAPARYVAGEETAAVHFVNESDARPTSLPPRPFERGIHGRPTLVQNVESLAYAALIARFGDGWYRRAGRGEAPGTALLTTTAPGRSSVVEVELGTTVSEVAGGLGVSRDAAHAVLVGGYFGGWLPMDEAWRLALDPHELRRVGRGLGCGVVSFLANGVCGVRATARIMDYMAGQSAAQCGPCAFGLRAIADATSRIATNLGTDDDLVRIERWAGQLAGRGACRHPDGAVGLLHSALNVFGDEFAAHARSRTCSRPRALDMAA